MPSTQFVNQFVKGIRQTGSLLDKATRPVRSTENITAVAQSVNNHQHQLAIFLKT